MIYTPIPVYNPSNPRIEILWRNLVGTEATPTTQKTASLMAGPPVRYRYGRKRKKNDIVGITPRWRYVLELHLAGKRIEEIQELTGYAPPTIYKILSDPRMIAERQQIMKYYDLDFEALYKQVIETIRVNLNEEDPKVRNDAAKIWLKAHGKFQADAVREGDTNISAEKIVFQILNQAREERKQLTQS